MCAKVIQVCSSERLPQKVKTKARMYENATILVVAVAFGFILIQRILLYSILPEVDLTLWLKVFLSTLCCAAYPHASSFRKFWYFCRKTLCLNSLIFSIRGANLNNVTGVKSIIFWVPHNTIYQLFLLYPSYANQPYQINMLYASILCNTRSVI